MAQRLTADEFFTGLFAALQVTGWNSTFSLRNERFDKAVESIYDQLQNHLSGTDISPRFMIYRHPDYGDSLVVRDGISTAAQRGLVSLDDPEYQDFRLRLGAEEAEKLLQRMPGGRLLFVELAREFSKAYESAARTA